MARFLARYLDNGYSEIFVVDYSWNEESSGYQTEHTREVIVARDASEFVRFTTYLTQKFGWSAGHEFSETKEKISEREYKTLIAHQKRSDTTNAIKALEKEKGESERRNEASKKLSESAPNCPRCGKQLVNRRGPRGSFWGCPSYPECKGSANFTAEQTRLWNAL